MKRLALWLLLSACAPGLRAQTPDAEFLQIYTLIQEGETLERSGQAAPALDRFMQAQKDLQIFAKAHPSWNQKIIGFRLDYLSAKVGTLREPVPTPASRPHAVPDTSRPEPAEGGGASKPSPVPPDLASARARTQQAETRATDAEARMNVALHTADEANARANGAEDRNARLALDLRQSRDRIEVLEATQQNLENVRTRLDRERVTLDARLKEALSPKSADIDPGELSKAQERNLLLMKENEILKASLERQVAENKRILDTAARAIELERQLDSARTEVASRRRENRELQGENQKLEARVEALTRKSDRKPDDETAGLRNEIEFLKRELVSARKGPAEDAEGGGDEQSLARLRDDLSRERSAAQALRSDNAVLVREIEKLTSIGVTPASLKTAEVPPIEVAGVSGADMARMRRLERERDVLRQELESARAEIKARETTTPARPSPELSREVERLGARLAVFEAKAEPYSRDELALFRPPARQENLRPAAPIDIRSGVMGYPGPGARATSAVPRHEPFGAPIDAVPEGLIPAGASEPRAVQVAQVAPSDPPPSPLPSSSPARTNAAPAASGTNVTPSAAAASQAGSTNLPSGPPAARRRTVRDLPPGASILAAQAQRAFAQHRFDDAEKNYRDILKLDENNVFTLANLAAILVERGGMEEGQALLQRALQIDPQDPFSLSLEGIIRFRQQRYDEAFDALSRSAQIDPDNADTQNYLGITLSQRGQRKAAETALRKALKLDPGSASAHYNLAVVYATQKPPFLEMARYHYEKSRRAGQPANPAFEGVLRGTEPEAKPQ